MEQPLPSPKTNRKPLQVGLTLVGSLILIVFGAVQLRSGLRSLSGSGGTPDSQERAKAAELALRSMKTLRDPSGFSMDYPASWEALPTVPGMLLKIRIFGGKVNVIVTAEDEPPGTTIAQYEQGVEEAVAKNYPQLKFNKLSSRDIEIGGLPARRRIYAVETPASDGRLVPGRQLSVVCIKANKAYLISGSALEDWFPQFEPVFDRMIGSIKFSD